MKKVLIILLVIVINISSIFSQVNKNLMTDLKNDDFANNPLYDMAFAIEELDELISTDTSYISKWKKYVTPIGNSNAYKKMYIDRRNLFLQQLEVKRGAISATNYKLMKTNFATFEYEEYENYSDFVDEFIDFPGDVNTIYMLALLTVGDKEFESIKKAKQFPNLEFWLDEGIYDMQFNFSSPNYVIPINCRKAIYLNKKHADSQNKYIKQGVAIFNKFLKEHEGEY